MKISNLDNNIVVNVAQPRDSPQALHHYPKSHNSTKGIYQFVGKLLMNSNGDRIGCDSECDRNYLASFTFADYYTNMILEQRISKSLLSMLLWLVMVPEATREPLTPKWLNVDQRTVWRRNPHEGSSGVCETFEGNWRTILKNLLVMGVR